MLQLDFLGFTAGSYAAWLYKSNHILMRTEREKGQLYKYICRHFIAIAFHRLFCVASEHPLQHTFVCFLAPLILALVSYVGFAQQK